MIIYILLSFMKVLIVHSAGGITDLYGSVDLSSVRSLTVVDFSLVIPRINAPAPSDLTVQCGLACGCF